MIFGKKDKEDERKDENKVKKGGSRIVGRGQREKNGKSKETRRILC